MIIVTGASGRLGRAILEQLLERLPGAAIGASVRDPGKAKDLARRGVRVRRGDFADAGSLGHAFERATQVLIVSSNAGGRGGDPIAQHRAAIAAARDAGARRILYTSHMGANAQSRFPPMRTHAATEAMLAEAGVPFTALRNGFYAQSTEMMMGDVAATRAVAAPADGTVSWTTHADLAAAAAVILAEEGRFDGPTPPLTAQEALDLSDLAAIAGDLLGQPIERRVTPDAAFRAQMVAGGTPERYADLLVGLYEAARDGEFAAIDPTLPQLIGRVPIRMRDVLAERLLQPSLRGGAEAIQPSS